MYNYHMVKESNFGLYKEGQGINFTKIPETFPSSIEYKFSTGQNFDLYSNPKGECRCIVTQNGQQLFDLAQYAPKNSKFVNEKYLDDLNEKKYGTASIDTVLHGRRVNRRAHMRTEKKDGKTQEYLINAQRKTKSPKDIFILLHEIGHALDFETRQDSTSDSPAEELSDQERAASLNGLKIAVDVHKKYGVNMLEFFGSYQEVENFISNALASYRKSAQRNGASQEETGKLFDLAEMDSFKKLGIQLFNK